MTKFIINSCLIYCAFWPFERLFFIVPSTVEGIEQDQTVSLQYRQILYIPHLKENKTDASHMKAWLFYNA